MIKIKSYRCNSLIFIFAIVKRLPLFNNELRLMSIHLHQPFSFLYISVLVNMLKVIELGRVLKYGFKFLFLIRMEMLMKIKEVNKMMRRKDDC
jgi:hypothetical protein